MDLRLKNKLIVVSGGAGGIGTVLCDVLRRKGAKVVVADRTLSDPVTVQNFFSEEIRFPRRKLDGYVSLVYGGEEEYNILTLNPMI